VKIIGVAASISARKGSALCGGAGELAALEQLNKQKLALAWRRGQNGAGGSICGGSSIKQTSNIGGAAGAAGENRSGGVNSVASSGGVRRRPASSGIGNSGNGGARRKNIAGSLGGGKASRL
jgi:hypothetical protein